MPYGYGNVQHAAIGDVGYVNSHNDSTEWASVLGSRYGVRWDPEPGTARWGAMFSTRERAEADRAAYPEGSAGRSAKTIVKVQYVHECYFRITPEEN